MVSKEFHASRRSLYRDLLEDNSVGFVFSGDTLFKGSWGRTDLPTSSFKDVISSITNKLLTLPSDTFVYPGHGSPTKIVDEAPIYLKLTAGRD